MVMPGQVAELHRLLRDRERARDHGLRGDHRRHGREDHHRDVGPVGEEQEERVGDRGRVVEDQRALAEVVEGEGREDEQEPGAPDRRPAEVAHVRVEGFRAGDGQDDRSHRDERDLQVCREEVEAVRRVQCLEDRRVARDLADAGYRDDHEPDDHHRTEQPADDVGPELLREEQDGEDADRDRQDEVRQPGRGDLDAFDCGHHRDRRGDHAVAVEQRHAEEAGGDQRRSAVFESFSCAPWISAIRAMMPPSPSLSARMMKVTNLSDTIIVIDQKTREITP